MADGTKHKIRARSHLLHLLGEELIGDDRLAVFELVKNSYDADATVVEVTVDVQSGSGGSITVKDNGSGMSRSDIVGKWLELATSSKRTEDGLRSPIYMRRRLGEKGVGRIAALKLGSKLRMLTRAEACEEIEVEIDWDSLIDQDDYLEGLEVDVIQKSGAPTAFDGCTGTMIEISGLRRGDWSRRDLRGLYRLVTSLSSPFEAPDKFSVKFSAPGREADLKDLIAPNDFLDISVWKYRFTLADGEFSWSYDFNPPNWKSVKSRHLEGKSEKLELTQEDAADGGKRRKTKAGDEPIFCSAEDLKGIGTITGVIFAYYRRSEVLNSTGSSSQVRSWLDDQTGVRVYRDGVRVFNYGEKNDDWLGLNARRINTPAGKLGASSVVSAIHLDLDSSYSLKEKTNREGFDQNPAYNRLKRLVLSAFEHLERLHSDDRKALDEVIKGGSSTNTIKFVDAIKNIKGAAKKNRLGQEVFDDIEVIEREFEELRDVMTNAGMAGLNLAVIFHEVEREVESIASALERGVNEVALRSQVENLHQLLQGFAPLLRKNSSKNVQASGIVRSALSTRQPRFNHHKVILSTPILTGESPDFKVKAVPNLVAGALGNLLDNALYWARYRRERDECESPAAVMVLTDWDQSQQRGLIAVVDNGIGFSFDASRALEAFHTTRAGGMGLGLYFARHVMEQCGGEITVHTAQELRDEISVPEAFDGAAVVMRFKETN